VTDQPHTNPTPGPAPKPDAPKSDAAGPDAPPDAGQRAESAAPAPSNAAPAPEPVNSDVSSGDASSSANPAALRPASRPGLLAGYRRPGFIAAVVVLLVALVGLQALIRQLGLVLIKKPIPLQRNLEELATTFGPYEVVKKHGKLPKAQEEVLGTTDYISWILHDTRLEKDEPGALIRLHIPYYTGQIDSVPHVPDRCFVAGGALPNLKQVMTARLDARHIRANGAGDPNAASALTQEGRWVDLPHTSVPLTIVRFASDANPELNYAVAYFFVANHDYVATPEGVRIKAFNPFDTHAYWAKVEVMPYGVSDPEQTRRIVGEFLAYAMPEIMLCLPDWKSLKRNDKSPDPQHAAMH